MRNHNSQEIIDLAVEMFHRLDVEKSLDQIRNLGAKHPHATLAVQLVSMAAWLCLEYEPDNANRDGFAETCLNVFDKTKANKTEFDKRIIQ